MERITSLQNNRIKNIQKLSAKARERKAQGLFIIEGAREITLAIAGKYVFDSIYLCPELFAGTDYPEVLQSIPNEIIYEVSDSVFEKIAYREGSDGILALAKPKPHHLSNLQLPDNPFIIVLEAVEKPGNLGAILRTADAAGVDAVLVCDALTDMYNPNVIRSSVGCIFTVPVAVGANEKVLNFLKKQNIRTFAAELTAAQKYHETDFTISSAIIMGTEADGLTDFWLKNADQRIKIPMRGVIDSLNVSVSTAILTFEAMRQRESKHHF
ncbi:MAG: RNA methyltransferase [Candidatus Symbiothrix sp.]|jgi:TrmH family RNA methyltransferase|nr:RNA methyltransferase [Candidatus Symbiothrix sp.]